MNTVTAMVIATMMGTAMQAEGFPQSFDTAVAHSRVMNAGYVEDASKRYLALSPAGRQQLAAALDALNGLPLTADGVRQALQLLSRQVAAFPAGEPPHDSTGRTPGQQAMQAAGMCLIHGRLAQVADAAKGSAQDAAALVQMIQREPTLSDRDRGLLLRELEQSYGRELYVKASQQASSTKGSK
ncbi:MAG TPA: hypothetical protein VFK10_11635 [Burkholderiaceae bacterium]|nr:hypothetical protein [Burkholderiaceae bacterium]